MGVNNNYKEKVVDLVESFINADKLEFSEAIVQDIVVDNEVEKEKEVVEGVQNGDLVPIIENTANYTMFPVADETECGTQECDMDVKFSSVKWDLALMKCKVPICLNKFEREFLRFFQTQRKFDNNPNLDELILKFIGERFKQGLENAKWRRAYFADPASTSKLLQGSSGFFIKADAATVVGETKVEIAKNAGATYKDQIMTGKEVYDLFGEMYDLAVLHTWFNPMTFMFEVTWQMANAYASWLNKLGHNAPTACQCPNPEGITAPNVYNINNLYYNGIPIKPRISFDGVIGQVPELNGNNVSGAKRLDPNRAILAKNENMLIGTSETDQLAFFDIWHNKDDEKIYMRGGSYIGASIPKLDEIIYAN